MTNQKGFSIIEFIVTMSLLLIVFAAAFSIFVPVARRSKAESANVQTQIEGVIGLELLRKDVVHAGAGLPWRLGGANYSEASQAGRSDYNDDKSTGDEPPRPIVVANDVATAGFGLNHSDYLVIKSQLVASPVTTDGTNYQDNPAAEKWTYVNPTSGTVRDWPGTSDDMVTTDRVIVVRPTDGNDAMVLTVDTSASNKFWTNYATTMPAAFTPTGTSASYLFGIDSTTDPRMPFNRADYYLSTANVPTRCAPGTGVLVKRVLRQDNGQVGKELPLLDCVATFQVAIGLDNTFADGTRQKNCLTNDPATITINNMPAFSVANNFYPADGERETVREVRLYILAQEGNFDMDYTFRNFTSGTSVLAGEADPADCDAPGGTGTQNCDCSGTGADATLGYSLDMSTLPTSHAGVWTFEKFRWRVYKMVIKPESIVAVEQ